MARTDTAYLEVPSVIRHEIRIGEAGNLTHGRKERDQMDEQPEGRDSDGKARGRHQFREAWKPPARLSRDVGKPSHAIFDGKNRREDAEEWGYQRRPEGGKRKRQADGADAQ